MFVYLSLEHARTFLKKRAVFILGRWHVLLHLFATSPAWLYLLEYWPIGVDSVILLAPTTSESVPFMAQMISQQGQYDTERILIYVNIGN